MGNAVAAYLERYQSLGLDGSPCTDTEFAEVERGAGIALPAAYKAYLLVAGRHPPSALVGSDCTIGSLPELRGGADELLAECGQPPLPAQAFVVLMHQDYQFLYFLADGSLDDPPLFYYRKGEPWVVKKFERFSDLVAICVGEARPAFP